MVVVGVDSAIVAVRNRIGRLATWRVRVDQIKTKGKVIHG
jgi:hypothetical protein